MANVLKKNFDHMLNRYTKADAIEFSFGEIVLRLKPVVPAISMVRLVNATNAIAGSVEYLKASLIDPGQAEDVDNLLAILGMEDLGKVIDEYVEMATSFESPQSKE